MAKEFLVQDGQGPDELARENETLREDAEDYNNRIEDLKSQVERLTAELAQEKASQAAYEENHVGDLNEKNIGLARRVAELEGIVASMRLNGAVHWFVYGYQQHDGVRYVERCGDCDKDKGHPAHFGQGARYLDSREVEKAAKEAQERLCNVLVDGLRLDHRVALNMAREILRGIPGIDPFQEAPSRPEVRG